MISLTGLARGELKVLEVIQDLHLGFWQEYEMSAALWEFLQGLQQDCLAAGKIHLRHEQLVIIWALAACMGYLSLIGLAYHAGTLFMRSLGRHLGNDLDREGPKERGHWLNRQFIKPSSRCMSDSLP